MEEDEWVYTETYISPEQYAEMLRLLSTPWKEDLSFEYHLPWDEDGYAL